MMYEELVKSLRAQADYYCCHMGINSPPAMMFIEAADAIEDLQNKLQDSENDNINLTGWLAEEHAKHLWIPVTERLPEESGHYLIYVVGGEFKQWSMVTMAYYHKKFYYDDMEDNFDEITHWMPLPEPPTQTFGNYLNHCQKSKEGE